MNDISLTVRQESWPIRGAFRISRGAKTAAEVVVVEVTRGPFTGRGECVPYARYGESLDSVTGEIERVRKTIEGGVSAERLLSLLPSGAARNAVDCALWDLAAKASGRTVADLLGVPAPGPQISAYTLSLDSAEAMGAAAKLQADRPLLKLKLGGAGDVERVAAVRENAPRSRIIVDANEAWTPAMIADFDADMARLGVELIEQPLPADKDEVLADIEHSVPLCADESCHDLSTLDEVAPLYDYINVKLDKTGGLTEALRLVGAARDLGLGVMVGCMLGTSLAMAPALLLGSSARYIDLDGPLLLDRDREPGLRFEGSVVHPPQPALWG
ncbi:N-acetyl-D-Glu racemase DgcA [Oceanibacterium hippocampi]|uniref:Dipeptide epimerase n=1 Tax=Oceanibacterium hippocampi TaxID=745714 RepID=A0A1Y5TV01_9PROT|nr:N-acetyl-D-Glu racemase DgcA [Oceanibacterium hippocampi]SLN70356.1 L-Ala-D/L-Glu epimerase [Oceanibacterium hippocampi]